ncbi:homeobox-DDT domain protein RLT2 [Dendrobium catenatum]|uniref:homeobox-DDT domain protein RLT2 n=1 Tax=Dendrobium catenatum TaxID=906689 RepID=UPI0009F35537|nr:homeobox-DDT domain protein RLT2 [Dendrobium catenatum]
MMEIADSGDGNPPPEGWKKLPEGGEDKPPKRKMKSPYQLEILEKTYAVETYPSETVRAELSAKTGLSDRQLQMWFCHRRLKDRKFAPGKKAKKVEEPLSPPPSGREMIAPPGKSSICPSSIPFPVGSGELRKAVARVSPGVSRIGAEVSLGKRYYEQPILVPQPRQLSVLELRIIASVEGQLGEPLRDDGPILGVEFDPLPPGAFGAPIESETPAHSTHVHASSLQFLDRLESSGLSTQGKQLVRSYDGKSMKTSAFLPSMDQSFLPSSLTGKRKIAGSGVHAVHPQVPPRTLQEYQFLPEQPSIRSESYERVPQSHFYDSPVAAPSSRMPSLPAGSQYLHGNDHVAPTYTFQGHISSSGLLSQQAREQLYTNEYDTAPHGSPFGNSTADPQFGIHQSLGLEDPFSSSERRIIREEDSCRTDRKRKSEEARIAKEVEAHEKRIRKELEKQDSLRRKREELMRREMERLDRDRRKEEERMLREKQREEERFLREQRRETERREKILLKESRRAEKLRRKEELRKEKEAARLKAANERATARRIAKESMELIEDERLELMELAASRKGLASIVSLDGETLEQLDSFRGLLNTFPPKSVKLKKPFSVQPWIDSEENVGNFLMAWKFLITFADTLGLWPFTLDEFLQSLHDYDSRLLGEIHVALLKSVIKDIEEFSRTPAVAPGVNQNSVANPGGGHPHIVEGAYAWGFNICSWQQHLNYFTWPEILRQFALSAGFGPQLKKRNVERTYFRDGHEGNDGEDVISTLRNGAAAENAVALMQVRGYNHRRRPRHRLTPGTVKFAAFYVLSLEGSKGLTILEVAEKIQKSGLRDLTTSKTPEASIAAALSRDTKLFERTAPSTYCVRTAFRKNPVDAEAVLAAAREKIQIFQCGLSDSDEVEKDAEDVDDGERDEDSEFEGADDPEVDDCSVEVKMNKDLPCMTKLKGVVPSNSVNNKKKEILCDGIVLTPPCSLRNSDKDFQVDTLVHSNQASISGAIKSTEISSNCNGGRNTNMEDAEIDESNLGDPWVQGLTEGDYTDLSVEERLNALVALIGVAIEGNSIRVILEERLEAATALKKQMWAEAQLDKRRYKEEYLNKSQYSSFLNCKPESTQVIVGTEGSQTPLQLPYTKESDGNLEFLSNDQFPDVSNLNNIHNMSTERHVLGQELSTNPDSFPLQHYGHAAEKPRFQLKSYIGHKAEQLYVYRSLPLGQDRRRNRYWLFSTSTSPNDPGSGRIFFESKDGFWRLIDSEETFDTLLAALDTRGIRESHLHSMLQRIETTFKEALTRHKKHFPSTNTNEFLFNGGSNELIPSPDCYAEHDSPSSVHSGVTSDTIEYSKSFRVDLGRSKMERNSALKRYRVFIKWMWKECYNSLVLCAMRYGKKRCSELLQTCHICYQSYFMEERHCTSCHRMFKSIHKGDAMFAEHIAICITKRKTDKESESQILDSSLPMGVRLLKAQLSLIEVSIPAEALQPFWTEGYRKSWGVKLNSASSADDFLQLLTLLEGAIKRDHLSSNFETTNELLSSAKASSAANNTLISGSVPVLPWIPDTTSAVALRLMELDASISYMPQQKSMSQKEGNSQDFFKPSRFTIVKNLHEFEPAGTPLQLDYQREGRWLDSGSGRRGRGRGGRGGRVGRGRGRGGRGTRASAIVSRAEFNIENINSLDKTRKYSRRGRTRGRGRRRGRRSVRPRQRSVNQAPTSRAAFFHGFGDVGACSKEESAEESLRSSGGDEWGIEARTYNKQDENSAGSQSDDDNEQASGDEYDDQVTEYSTRYNQPSPMGIMDDESEDEEVDEDVGEEEDYGDQATLEDMDGDVDEEDEEMGDDDEMTDADDGNGDEDEGPSSFSSGYSD